MLKFILVLCIFCSASLSQAKKNNKVVVKETQQELSYGSSQATAGGTLTMNLIGEPPTIHPITSMDLSALNVHDWTMGSLLVKDPRTFEWKPSVAERWETSKDGKIFTFWLRQGVTFHDGRPLTAEDVKFSFDAIFDPQYKAASRIPYFENIAKVEVLDSHQVKFYAKDSYFLNFDVAAGMFILPKHVYGDVEKSKKMNKELVGCGPYKLEIFDRGNKIVLKNIKIGLALNCLRSVVFIILRLFSFVLPKKKIFIWKCLTAEIWIIKS
jgi:microcin C transport system substrate-binding protein